MDEIDFLEIVLYMASKNLDFVLDFQIYMVQRKTLGCLIENVFSICYMIENVRFWFSEISPENVLISSLSS